MRTLLLWLVPSLICAAVSATDHATDTTGSPDRSELLKAAVNRDRGTISALEPASSAGKGVYVGYSTGVVLHCYGSNRCTEFSGTPNTAVQYLAVSRHGDQEVIWVSYRQGALYQCIDGACGKFLWERETYK